MDIIDCKHRYCLIVTEGDKRTVGSIITTQGFTRAVVGVVAGGVLINRFGADTVMKISGVFGVLGLLLNVLCFTGALVAYNQAEGPHQGIGSAGEGPPPMFLSSGWRMPWPLSTAELSSTPPEQDEFFLGNSFSSSTRSFDQPSEDPSFRNTLVEEEPRLLVPGTSADLLTPENGFQNLAAIDALDPLSKHSKDQTIMLLFVLNFVWSVFTGLSNSGMETIFARSVMRDCRESLRRHRYICFTPDFMHYIGV